MTFRHLGAQADGLVPPEVLDELARHAGQLAQRNRRLARGLEDTAALFDENSIRLLVFKGPALTIDLYGDLALRECGDLDLLVHRDDLPRALELLRAAGYRNLRGEAARQLGARIGAYELCRDGVTLDVQTGLAPWWLNYRIDFDSMWANGIPLTDGPGLARKPRPEDSLLVLSIHGTKHWWERLRWICDVAELVNSGGVTEWDYVDAEAARTGSRRTVYLGVWLAADLLSARLPADVRRRLDRFPVVRRLADQVGAWRQQGQHGLGSRAVRQRFRFRMLVRERARDRCAHLAGKVLTQLGFCRAIDTDS